MKKFLYGILILAAVLLLSGCSARTQEGIGYQVNYVNTDGTRLVEESYVPENQEGTPLIQELLDRMRVPQYSGDYHTAIPDSVEVRNISLADKSVTVDFNTAYREMDSLTEILMRAAVVKTLCQIPEVGDVSFTIEGIPFLDSMGMETGKMTAGTFIDTKGRGINSYQYAALTLYFASEDGKLMVKEMRNVHYSTNTTPERVVVEELLSGPVNSRLGRIAPAGIKILGISREDDVCMVNLDSSFNQSFGDGKVSPEVSLYAIVNALCDSCGVEKVQFQINGDSGVKFRDSLSLVEPFEKNEELIQPAAGSSGSENEMLEPSIGMDQVIGG